jgi:vacuolar-type H+-ATPase subunit E/Vma4
LKTHVKALIIEQKTKAIDQIKSNSTIQKKTYATTTKKSLIQNTAPNQVESEETAELKQIVSDLVKLVKSLLALVPNQITITETLRKIMNV